MIVIEKNEGAKIPYSVTGTRINFDDGMLAMKLERHQKDWPVHKDICMDADGCLTMGVGEGLYYVAEIDIPAREYQEIHAPVSEVARETHEMQMETELKPLPFDMNKVTLTLWAIENPTPVNE